MSRNAPSETALRVAGLSQSADNLFSLRSNPEELAEMARALDLLSLRKLSFEGRVIPLGGSDWQLEGHLGATVVQSCVVTLEPVTTRIETKVLRQYVLDYADPEEPEAEMPEDDTVEPLGSWIDPGQVMMEALALALPDYPRKGDADLGQVVLTEPGKAAMTDEDAKPFAGLAALRKALDKDKE
ncbi:MAG: DUF177 domain-containing protein [Sulfitobacter sp.]|nr:DUF177 domain-containing protein [Sulfitobacter sp.]